MATVRVCDACLRPLSSEERRVKSRHRRQLWHESAVARTTLTMHEACWQSLLRHRQDMVDQAMAQMGKIEEANRV